MISGSRVCAYIVGTMLLWALDLQPAAAFCGFYVTGADSRLYANATMVVLMRDGTKTVLSMQNNYEGPPDEFALVIPVPTVLQEQQVKTLPHDVFTRVDALGAPRLVEYWEVDPCLVAQNGAGGSGGKGGSGAKRASGGSGGSSANVTVEASFAVGEYDIVILSTNDSSSLEGWLVDNSYHIPDGAAELLMPYVASGMKFFVAKVNPERIELKAGQTALSPLRFYYDSPEFTLPIRLGLVNSRQQQDLIVNIIAPDRYEVANHDNITIPTNIRLQNEVRDDLGGFYEALFSRVLEKHPGAVVTEYAWGINSCDPCPGGVSLSPSDQLTLGLDVARGVGTRGDEDAGASFTPLRADYTLTRLHYRYSPQSLGDDLVFQVAAPITGGRGTPGRQGELSMQVDAQPGTSNFQGRYVILHPWADPIACEAPQRGFWGGPPDSRSARPMVQAAANTALLGEAPRPGELPALLAQSLTSLDVMADNPLDPLPPLRRKDAGTPDGAAISDGGVDTRASESCECSLARPGQDRDRGAPRRWSGLAMAGLLYLQRRRSRQRRARR